MRPAPAPPSGRDPVVAVVMSRFPKFTETFVVTEILGLSRQGLQIEIFPLLAEQGGPRQPAAEPLVRGARYGAPWGLEAWRTVARTAWRRPRALAGIVGRLMIDTRRHPSMLAKDLILLPRVCAIAEEIEARQVDHVHAHFLTHGGFAAWALHRLTGRPYSVVAHGSDVHRHQAMMRTKVAEAAFVAAVSSFNRDVIIRHCGPDVADRVQVVRAGIDLDRITPREQEPTGDPVLLCVGTLHEVKGQRFLLEAAARLSRQGRNVRVVLLGDGPDGDSLKALTDQLGCADRVLFAGAVNHDEVLRWYERSTVVVTPSVPSSDGRREGIPTVLMEAMATGVPVVGSDLTGIPELIEHGVTGLLSPPGDAAALADALASLLDDPDMAARLGRAGRERVAAEFDVVATTRQLARMMTTPSRESIP